MRSCSLCPWRGTIEFGPSLLFCNVIDEEHGVWLQRIQLYSIAIQPISSSFLIHSSGPAETRCRFCLNPITKQFNCFHIHKVFFQLNWYTNDHVTNVFFASVICWSIWTDGRRSTHYVLLCTELCALYNNMMYTYGNTLHTKCNF